MPLQTSNVQCALGAWTQLCQLNPRRKSLLIQAAQGALLCSPNQGAAGAAAPTNLGSLPSGIAISLDQSRPNQELSLSRGHDDDLVEQQWFGWAEYPDQIPAGNVDLVAPLANSPYLDNLTGASATFTAPPGLMLACADAFANSGAGILNLFSGQLGVLTADESKVISAPDGLQQGIYLFSWQHPGGTDTIFFTAQSTGPIQSNQYVDVFQLGGATALDKKNVNSGVASPVAVSTAATTQALEFVVVVVAIASAGGVQWTQPAGWTQLGQATNETLAATFMQYAEFFKVVAATGVQSFSLAFVPAATAWGVAIATYKYGALKPISVSVMESFDEPPAEETAGTITVGLPQLGPHGKAALADLLARISGGAADQSGAGAMSGQADQGAGQEQESEAES